nr:hypothetical protein CFP56_73665 [Quercus suber]
MMEFDSEGNVMAYLMSRDDNLAGSAQMGRINFDVVSLSVYVDRAAFVAAEMYQKRHLVGRSKSSVRQSSDSLGKKEIKCGRFSSLEVPKSRVEKSGLKMVHHEIVQLKELLFISQQRLSGQLSWNKRRWGSDIPTALERPRRFH